MREWFVYNGIDSRDMGLYIQSMPPVVRPEERIEYVNVPGRAGSLSYREGENVFEAYNREVVVWHKRREPLREILLWLRGSGQLILSNEPERSYVADVAAEVRFSKQDNDWEQATIPFYCQPYKLQYPPELPIEVDGETQIVNPGNMIAHPRWVLPDIDGVNAQLTVNGTTFAFEKTTLGGTFAAVLDSAAELILDGEGALNMDLMDLSAGFPVLQPGANTVTAEGFAAPVTLEPRWRWI